jgi:hypothetical protein
MKIIQTSRPNVAASRRHCDIGDGMGRDIEDGVDVVADMALMTEMAKVRRR